MPVSQDQRIIEAMNYCRVVFILIAEDHATPVGVKIIFDKMKKDSKYFSEPSVHEHPEYRSIVRQSDQNEAS